MDQINSLFVEFETPSRAHDSDGAFRFYNEVYLSLFAEMAGNISTIQEMAENNFDIHTKMRERYVGIYENLIVSIRKLNYRLNETLRNISNASMEVSSGAIHLAQNAQAVVADEIGKLAADSAQSAVDTRELIAKALEEIDHGNIITENTAKVLEEVLNSMNEIQEVVRSASMASQEQATMLRDISHNIDDISSIVESSSSSAQQNFETSEQLTNQSDTMNSMIAEFRLREI